MEPVVEPTVVRVAEMDVATAAVKVPAESEAACSVACETCWEWACARKHAVLRPPKSLPSNAANAASANGSVRDQAAAMDAEKDVRLLLRRCQLPNQLPLLLSRLSLLRYSHPPPQLCHVLAGFRFLNCCSKTERQQLRDAEHMKFSAEGGSR